MTLVAKARTINRVQGAPNGDDTVGSGLGKALNRHGNGNIDPSFANGGVTKQVYTASWDQTLDGAIPAGGGLGLGVYVPVGFVVTEVSFDVQVVPVGPTNLALALNDDADLSASAAISGAPWSTSGLKHGKNAGASAVEVAYTVQGPVVLLTPKEIQLVGTVAVSTAGRVVVYVEGFQGPKTATAGAAIG